MIHLETFYLSLYLSEFQRLGRKVTFARSLINKGKHQNSKKQIQGAQKAQPIPEFIILNYKLEQSSRYRSYLYSLRSPVFTRLLIYTKMEKNSAKINFMILN